MKRPTSEPLSVYSARKLALERALDELAIIDNEAYTYGLWPHADPEINPERLADLDKLARDYFKVNFAEYRPSMLEKVCVYSAGAAVFLALAMLTKLQMSKPAFYSQIDGVRDNIEEALGFVIQGIEAAKRNKKRRG